MGSRAARYERLVPASRQASQAARGASKKRGTRCEIILRNAVERRGIVPDSVDETLLGKPDLVFREQRVLVFCDGDFWHGRNLKQRIAKLEQGHNAPYWVAKITGNVARDRRHTRNLRKLGWTVLRFWEKDIHANADRLARKIVLAVQRYERLGLMPTDSRVSVPRLGRSTLRNPEGS
jgi:DNA mismatch endonuclease (patch repair protein)